LLSVGVLLKKKGGFPNTHIEGNRALLNRGIRCAKFQDDEQLRRKGLAERWNDL
jgi:hypothetical protein